MQYKRPINVARSRKTGIPTYANSFQFLRANKLVLSVKLSESVNGWEIPPEVMARCKDGPLTAQEWPSGKPGRPSMTRKSVRTPTWPLTAWPAGWPTRCATPATHWTRPSSPTPSRTAKSGGEPPDAFAKRLKKAGIERPTRPRGRPRAITIIEVDDGGQTRWLPNFHPPDSAEHDRYDEADAPRRQETRRSTMRVWSFNSNTCRFDRVGRAALADVAVISDDTDVQVVRDHAPPTRWPSGEPLVVAGVEFDRELFE